MPLVEMSETLRRMTSDLDWAQHAPEVQNNPEHYGKSVVIYNKRVLAVGKNCPALLEEAAEKSGVPWQDLLLVIVPRPGLLEIPDRAIDSTGNRHDALRGSGHVDSDMGDSNGHSGRRHSKRGAPGG
jgi:hypothetical protein